MCCPSPRSSKDGSSQSPSRQIHCGVRQRTGKACHDAREGSALPARLGHRERKTVSQKQAVLSGPGEVSSVPPFSTREPARYQATRIITSVDGDSSQPPNVTRSLIARDGDKRREVYDSDTDLQTSYLEIPPGSFVLLP